MQWLQTLDRHLFRWINLQWSNPVLDQLMPLFAGNILVIAVTFVALFLIWKGGLRGVVCVILLLLCVGLCDWVCNTLKNGIARPRPFLAMTATNLLIGRGGSYSMPSSHAA